MPKAVLYCIEHFYRTKGKVVVVSEFSQERRIEQRVPSNEPVCFTDSSEWGTLCVGSVQDRSARGVAIQTDSIYPVGTSIEIEVVSTDAHEFDTPQFSTGTVSRIQQRSQGGYILGVHLDAPEGFPARALSVSKLVKLSGLTESPEENTPIVQESVPPPEHSPIKKTLAHTKPQRAYAQHIISLSILLLAATLYFGWGSEQPRTSDTQVGGVGNSLAWTSELPVKAAQEKRVDNTMASVQDSSVGREIGQATSASILEWETLDTVQEDIMQPTALPMNVGLLSEEAPQAALDTTEDGRTLIASLRARDIDQKSVAQVQAILFRAQEAARKGNRMGALYLSKEAVKSAATLPTPWQEVAQNFRQQLVQIPGALPTLPELSNGVVLTQALPELPANAPVVVHVDKSDFLMQVVKEGKVIWQFPIGLGLNNSTPEGIFSVGNKISLPEWYNKGNPVQGGAANNPLGDSWLGLSDQGTSTPIGIHPTKQGESIGEALSGGCIRMRPEDAERLYRMIPIGTPIVIRA